MIKIMTTSRAVVLFSVLFVTGACGVMENMDAMKSRTDEMSNQMKNMDDRVRTTNDQMDNVYGDGRQGGALDVRDRQWPIISSKNSSFADKGVAAAKYFQAFEFQMWKSELIDTPRYREEMFNEAVREFGWKLFGFINGPLPKLDPLSTDEKVQSLFAISVSLHELNLRQLQAAYEHGFKPISMYDLILDGLASKSAYERSPRSMNPYVQSVLSYEHLFLYMLVARYNICAAVVVDKVHSVTFLDVFSKLQLLVKERLTIDFSKLNAAELDVLNDQFLTCAIDTRKALRSFGPNAPNKPGFPSFDDVRMNDSLYKILKKATFKEDPTSDTGKQSSINRFKALYNDLLCESGACP